MRLRAYLTASESPRPFSEIVAERGEQDPRQRLMRDIAALELEAAAAEDLKERKRLQCEAEALRCALHEQPRGI
jgi:hypothetical protein